MVTALIAITILSIITAAVALVFGSRLRKQERERSDARAAALAAAAETHGAMDGGWKQVGGEWQWVAEPGLTSGPSQAASEFRSETRVHDSAPAVPEAFFGTVQRDQPRSAFPVFAAAGLILVLGGALLFLNTGDGDSRPASVETVVSAPLELVALGHERNLTVLTISGTVRNPASGTRLEGLTAVVSLLDRSGALVSTKDVPLDYRALRPGDEAPFTIAVPDPGTIARYRVSFRAGASVVPHIDRRSGARLASAVS